MAAEQGAESKTCCEERQEQPEQPVDGGYSLFSFLKELHELSLAKLPPTTVPEYPLERPHWMDRLSNRQILRPYPHQITLWDDFARLQDEIWSAFCGKEAESFVHQDKLFSHENQFLWNSIQPNNQPGSEEYYLRDFHECTVEHVVHFLVKELYKNDWFKQRFGLEDKTKFKVRDDQISHVIIQKKVKERCNPIFAVQVKIPHQLTLPELVAGFKAMEFRRDVVDMIEDQPDSFEGCAERLVGTAISDLHAYMLIRGVHDGYLCTGEAYLFVHIPYDDPTTAMCHLSIPSRDVVNHADENQLRYTAIGQVLAFTLHAMTAVSPSQAWYETVDDMGKWTTTYMDVLRKVPEEIRTNPPAMPAAVPAVAVVGEMSPEASSKPKQKAVKITREYCTMACLRGLMTGEPLDRNCPNADHHGFGNKHPFDCIEFIRQIQIQLDEHPDQGFEPLHIRGNTGFMLKASLLNYGYTVAIKGATERKAEYLEHEMDVYERLRPLQGIDIPVLIGEMRLSPSRPYWYHGERLVRMLVLSWAGVRLDYIADNVTIVNFSFDSNPKKNTSNSSSSSSPSSSSSSPNPNHDPNHDPDKTKDEDDEDEKKTEEEKKPDYDAKHAACIKRIQDMGIEIEDQVAWRNFLWNAELQRVVAIDFERFSLVGEDGGGSKRKKF